MIVSRSFMPAMFLGFLATLCLSGNPISFVVGGVRTSVLELVIVLLAGLLAFNRTSINSPLWKPYASLIASTLVPLVIGLSENGIERVFREYAQLIYTSVVFLGVYYRANSYISVQKLMKLACWLSTAYAGLYLLDNSFLYTDFISQYQFFWRTIIAFSILCLFARLLRLPEAPQLGIAVSAAMLVFLLLYVLEIRTRAFLIMLVIGIVSLSFSVISNRGRGSGHRKLLLLVAALFLAVATPIIIGMSDISVSQRGSLGRLLSLLNGKSALDLTVQYRLAAWSLAYDGFIQNPIFGQGFGSYLYLDPWINGIYLNYPSAMIHNTFLQILFVGGVVYLLGYVYFFFCAFIFFGVAKAKVNGVAGYTPPHVLRAFLLGFLVYAAFGTALFSVVDAPVFWFLVGYFCCPHGRSRDMRGGVRARGMAAEVGELERRAA